MAIWTVLRWRFPKSLAFWDVPHEGQWPSWPGQVYLCPLALTYPSLSSWIFQSGEILWMWIVEAVLQRKRNHKSLAVERVPIHSVIIMAVIKNTCCDFPGGPVVKNLPPNAGDAGSIPGWGTKIPHAKGQLSLCTKTREAHKLQLRPHAAKLKNIFKRNTLWCFI